VSANTTAPPPGLRRAQEVLDFWFGPDPLSPAHFSDRLHLWFGGDDPPELIAERDALVTSRFRTLMDGGFGRAGPLGRQPAPSARSGAAADQFPRHVYRGGRARPGTWRWPSRCTHSPPAPMPRCRWPSGCSSICLSTPIGRHAGRIHCRYRRLQATTRAHRKLFDSVLEFAQQHQSVISVSRFPSQRRPVATLHPRNSSSWMPGRGQKKRRRHEALRR
jgi:uncharacterized protein (DUF924 family)